MDDGIIKNITKEIIRECTHKGMEVSEAFISYYVIFYFKTFINSNFLILLNLLA